MSFDFSHGTDVHVQRAQRTNFHADRQQNFRHDEQDSMSSTEDDSYTSFSDTLKGETDTDGE
jgi:hypothetical protein